MGDIKKHCTLKAPATPQINNIGVSLNRPHILLLNDVPKFIQIFCLNANERLYSSASSVACSYPLVVSLLERRLPRSFASVGRRGIYQVCRF